jgi:hypothetical protein
MQIRLGRLLLQIIENMVRYFLSLVPIGVIARPNGDGAPKLKKCFGLGAVTPA